MLPQLNKFKEVALNLLFPQKCIGCGEEGGLLCISCQKLLPRIAPPFCPKCGKPQPSGIICPSCITWRTPLDGIRTPFRFEGVMREAIHQLKYKNLRNISPVLGSMLAAFFSDFPVIGQVLVPVPIHPKRLKERGFNQSGLLARDFGRLSGLPVEENILARNKFVIPQAKTKSVEERRRNVIGAFSCNKIKLDGKKIILIDDVTTSGATIDACALALKSAGAGSVWALVLTREL